MFGEEVVEVSTFRSMIEAEDAETDEHGRLLRDTVRRHGTGSARRDFTAKALFYDPPRRRYTIITAATKIRRTSCCA